MSTRGIDVYHGTGSGKTGAALGYAVHEAAMGGTAIVIQFLKKKSNVDAAFLRRMEPDIKLITFQKSNKDYADMNEDERFEEHMNMQNALHYARKVMMTDECNVLILDEILGLIDYDIVSEDTVISMLKMKPDDMEVILTGRVLSDGIKDIANSVYEIIATKKTKRMQ